jgi:hypothetical protein
LIASRTSEQPTTHDDTHPASKFGHDLARGLLPPDGTQVVEERRPAPANCPEVNKFTGLKSFW